MKSIGGFFESELPHGGARPHPGALGLSTGRACLMVMLENLRPRRVHVPFYTCDAALEPFARMGIETRSYGLEGNPLPLRSCPRSEPARSCCRGPTISVLAPDIPNV